jgi:hypothetical protein
MNWLRNIAEKIAIWVLVWAKQSPNVSAKEFEQWKREYKEDFGKDFK